LIVPTDVVYAHEHGVDARLAGYVHQIAYGHQVFAVLHIRRLEIGEVYGFRHIAFKLLPLRQQLLVDRIELVELRKEFL
jgi:hypothetical protein